MLGRSATLTACAVLLGACGSGTPPARAVRISSFSEAIGGPVANAKVGDFLLENGLIRAVVEQGQKSKLPLDVGGTLIDLDLVRPEKEFRGGNGLDQLGEIAPVANLYIGRATGATTARLTSVGDVAEVTVAAEAQGIQKILDALGLLLRRDFAGSIDYSKFRLYSEYRLQPGEKMVRIRTTVGFDVPFCRAQPEDHCNAECDDILYDEDCRCPSMPARCQAGVQRVEAEPLPSRTTPMGISDILLGDLPRPVGSGRCLKDADCNAAANETCVDITTGLGGTAKVCRSPSSRDQGVFVGDMLLFGGHLSPFIEGSGFDTESDIRRLFDSGEDTLSNPLSLNSVFAIGDRVSYGYSAPKGKVLVPVFGGPFSMGVTGEGSCRHDSIGCLQGRIVRSERWVSVGTGDANSAAEPLLKARGETVGTVRGVVRWGKSPRAASGAEVYALSDPRALTCDAACLARCTDLTSMTDAALTALPLEDLLNHTRCRTHDATHLDGVAGIVSQAMTDPGTDPLKDGDFRLVLAPGRYVLVAQSGTASRSPVVPVDVTANGTTVANLALVEPGKLLWTANDERGQPVGCRITVGQCLPGAACGSDTDCTAGDTCIGGQCSCARTEPWPLEMRGERFADGVHGFDESAFGHGELDLAPGTYDVIFTHGPHYTADRKRVTIVSNQSVGIHGTVNTSVDRAGWTSSDFHVHAEHSIDSGLGMAKRIGSFVSEDVEFLSSSDHDVLSRYWPMIESMGLSKRLGSQVGCEVTTQELGHFIGYPLNYQEYTGANADRVPANGAPEWRDLPPQKIFDNIRAAAEPGVPMIVEIPHPYTYFDYYSIDPKTIEPGDSIISLAGINPLVDPKNFSGDFEAMELMNSKSFDLIRRPTLAEVHFFSKGMDDLLALRRSGAIDGATYASRAFELSTEATRRFLHRTPEEQRAALAGDGNEYSCRCGGDGDCGTGQVCDLATSNCVSTVTDGGTAAVGPGLCRSLRGVIDDWFSMLNRGVRRTGVGGSDTHGLFGFDSAGTPRTMVETGGTRTPAVTTAEIVEGIKAGRVVVTNGPMIHFGIESTHIGGTMALPSSRPIALRVKVETGGWYDIDRLEVYRNGELIHWLSSCSSRRPGDAPDGHDHPCLDITRQTTVPVVEQTFEDTPTGDSWYVVMAMGLDGRTLSPVYSSATLARFGTYEIAQRIYDLVPALSGLRTPRFPSLYPTFPIGVTNPIWVDVGADGWHPRLPPPSWCTKGKDYDCK